MKTKITITSIFILFFHSVFLSQTGRKIIPQNPILVMQSAADYLINKRGCATETPNEEWEMALQKLIKENANLSGARVLTSYNIPVVIHIIHGGQALGTYPNISNAQAVSQINVLNNDFGGTGFNATTYPATAFTAYATAAGLPTANKDASGRPKISNFNISFCLATINKSGGAMTEIGIDRVNYNTFTLTSGYSSKDPANSAYNSPTTFQSFVDNIVKPQTVWDPTKYMNIWVTDEYSTTGLLGYATFPAGVTLSGIGAPYGSATTDGLWCWAKSFGNTGTLDPTYNKGRTATHEIGHWLGMRHIWGDGTCATDYCLDTPPAAAANGSSSTYPYPFHANTCTSPSGVSNTTPNGANGEMFMNFMDYTQDAYMYMFTEDQRTRAQTVMTNGTYRKFLGTHGLCATSSSTPAAAVFTMTNSTCNGTSVIPTNSSTGSPTLTYTWSASPSTGVSFSPSTNATTPTITFTSNGTFIITLAAQSGTTAISTTTRSIVVSSCTTSSTPATAIFTMTNSTCNGTSITPTNNSTGSPVLTYTWSASPSTGVSFSPSTNATTPTITFASNGTFIITLAAKSGTTTVNTTTRTIVVSTCTTTTSSVCSKTVTNISNTDTMYIATAGTDAGVSGCSPKAGYIFGSNCYDDLEKAEFFTASTYSNVLPGPALVTGAIVVYFKNGTRGTGGSSSTAVNLKMYNGTMSAGPGATALGTATANLGTITAATSTNNIGYLAGNPSLTYSPNIAIPYKYTFTSPISAPTTGFFLAVNTPTAAGDTAVIMNDFHATTNSSWERFSNGTWSDMNVSWPGLVNNMAIFPTFVCSISTSIENQNSLANNVNIVPNPSTGLFNVVMTLDVAQDITINVTNMLGQSIFEESHKSFTNGVIPIDLSNKNQGVYFINVSNGVNKNVQRVILTK